MVTKFLPFFILAIRALASKLVEQWLKAVKGEQVTPILAADIPEVILDFQSDIKSDSTKIDVTSDIEAEKLSNDSEKPSIIENDTKDEVSENDVKPLENDSIEKNDDPTNENNDTLPVLKITLKNGKQILSQVDDDNKASEDDSEKEKREKQKSKSRDKSHDKSSSSKENSSSSRSSSSSRHSSKSSDKGKSSSHKDSSSKHSSKDKYKDKDRHSSHSSKSKSSSSSHSKKSSTSSNSSSSKVKDGKSSQKHSSDKDKSREKNKNSKSSSDKGDDKTQTPSIQKLGKIPKLSDVKKEKPSISIEIRKPDEPKPKTVKTFHSKFRNHGLAEEVKPPPSRASLLSKKPPPAIPPTVSIPKRPSPVHNDTPPEKKPKTLLDIDKPGAIKLIPPKHKREYCNFLFLTLILTYFLFTGHRDMHLTLQSNTNNILIYNFKCGKSKMNNLTGLIFVQKLLVKYLFLIKVKFYKKIVVHKFNLFKDFLLRCTYQPCGGAPWDMKDMKYCSKIAGE